MPFARPSVRPGNSLYIHVNTLPGSIGEFEVINSTTGVDSGLTAVSATTTTFNNAIAAGNSFGNQFIDTWSYTRFELCQLSTLTPESIPTNVSASTYGFSVTYSTMAGFC